MTVASLSAFSASALAAAGEFTWAGVAERLATIVLAASIIGYVTVQVLKSQMRDMRDRLAEVAKTVGDLGDRAAAAETERMACELRCAENLRVQEKTFATREEFAMTLTEAVAGGKEQMDRLDQIASSFRKSVGEAHNRIDGLQERITRVEEHTGKGPK